MKAVIYRIYTSPEGKKKFLQGKIFTPKNYDFSIFYRDWLNLSTTKLWMTKYTQGTPSYNLDHLVFDFLVKEGIKEIHYYLVLKAKLLVIAVDKIERHLRLGNVFVNKLNNHTQYFIPERLFDEKRKDYPVPWIYQEVNINDLLREKDEELSKSQIISDEVKIKLYQKIKSSEPQLTQQLGLF